MSDQHKGSTTVYLPLVGQDPTPEPENLIPVKVKMSHYDPSLGGVNCFRFVDGECLSKMSSGIRWQEWYNREDGQKAVACPMSVPFWTVFIVDGVRYTCLDRGGMIVVTAKGEYWLDVLGKTAPYGYGTVTDGFMVLPEK